MAAAAVDRPTLLLAVPGSGKTTTLVSRIGYMIYGCRIRPENILTITYTVAASRDMEARFRRMFGGSGVEVKFQTINALCQSIIYRYNRMTGGSGFELVENSGELLKEIYMEVMHDYPTDMDLKNLQQIMTYIKNMMLKDEEIQELKFETYPVKELYDGYTAMLKERRLMDFDDQMVYAYRILRKYPQLLAYYRQRYPYICVDEAQDTSRIQHEIIGLLAGDGRGLFMVGDEDQSIYGFRAAYPQALMEFERKYPGAQILLLEQNFRSTPQIVSLANDFIARNEQRHKKNMFTAKNDGSQIKCVRVTRGGQYQRICSMFDGGRLGDECRETAILYRNNDSAVPLIHHLIKQNISYRCKGMDAAFFSSPPVQFLKDVFELAMNPANSVLFLKVYWKLGCYIKKGEAWQAAYMCRNGYAEDAFEALLTMDSLSQRKKDKISETKRKLTAIALRPAAENVDRFVEAFDYYKKDGEKYFLLSQLTERKQSCREFLKSLDDLQQVIEEGSHNGAADVILSTIHSSKGLEYDRVVIIDAIDGVLPASPDGSKAFAASGIEEERRLFYVGATRARKELVFYEYVGENSPFIQQFMQKEPKVIPVQPESAKRGSSYDPMKYYRKKSVSKAGGKASHKLKTGEKVTHVKFGKGRVLEVTDRTVTIDFVDCGQKKFLIEMVENKLKGGI